MKSWNAKIQFPTDSDYINRVTTATFGPSKSSGNPMITLELEIVSPRSKDVGGEEIELAGVKCKHYLTIKVLPPDNASDKELAYAEEASKDALGRCKEFYAMAFPDDPDRATSLNPENPDLTGLVGLCFYTQMQPDVEEQRKNPTPEQIAAGQKIGKRPEGDIMKHPVSGKALIQYWPKIREVFGLAPKDAAAGIPY